MAYVKLFFTTLHSGGQVESVSPGGDGDPVEFTILSDTEIVAGTPVGITVKADSGYTLTSVEVIPAGTSAAMCRLAPDSTGEPGAWGAYGAKIEIGAVTTSGVPFWVNCKAAANEEPVNDVTISLAVTGVAAAV